MSEVNQEGTAMTLSSQKSSCYTPPILDGKVIWYLENNESPSALLGSGLRVNEKWQYMAQMHMHYRDTFFI